MGNIEWTSLILCEDVGNEFPSHFSLIIPLCLQRFGWVASREESPVGLLKAFRTVLP